MTAFYDGAYDVLLSTSIVESGLDIPTANTLIVHRADMFGLAQLYQLRGRVGRAKQRAYALFTVPPDRTLTPQADRRLKVLQSLDTLGAGFQLASHDLDHPRRRQSAGRGAVRPHPARSATSSTSRCWKRRSLRSSRAASGPMTGAGRRRSRSETQRTTAELRALDLVPMAEFQLTSDTIRLFRTGYVAQFGAAGPDDVLYEAVSEGHRYPGMEHWLPLFHQRMATPCDYIERHAARHRAACRGSRA